MRERHGADGIGRSIINRLAGEKSPYLLQHADNPVDWYAWGPEALERAKREDKPILVSIGYSACHWCHVMAHESFENEAIARLMNDNFINIKVDREERPDVDEVYMAAVQALTGQGGWPLNVFLTPDAQPFFGGTYFPPESRHGITSWPQVLESVTRAFRDQHADVHRSAVGLTEHLRDSQNLAPSQASLSAGVLSDAYERAVQQFDWKRGGFGAAPKFPQPIALEFILRMHERFDDPRALEFVERTLHIMADGGIFDQLGGGFHRYSVDAEWIVPHFEKMLYDNALLAWVYVHAYQAVHDPFYRSIAEQTLDYLLREMRSPEGGFYAAEDADSEGVEGKFYVWTKEEIEHELDPELAKVVIARYGVNPAGNFEGKTILTVTRSIEEIADSMQATPDQVQDALDAARSRLLATRSRRVPPGKDTKILVSWNALAIRALAEAGRVLGRDDYLSGARQAAAFILSELRPAGRLLRSYKDGPSTIPAFLEDYAFFIEALVTLYETEFDETYLRTAQELANEMVRRFWDDVHGAFFDTPRDMEDLPMRPRNFFDNPIPSGNSAASSALLRLEGLTGDGTYSSWAVPAFRIMRDNLPRVPLGFSYLLGALDFYLAGAKQIAIVGDPREEATRRLVDVTYGLYLPNKVVAVGEGDSVPLLAGRTSMDGKPTAYVCERFACKVPVVEPDALALLLTVGST